MSLQNRTECRSKQIFVLQLLSVNFTLFTQFKIFSINFLWLHLSIVNYFTISENNRCGNCHYCVHDATPLNIIKKNHQNVQILRRFTMLSIITKTKLPNTTSSMLLCTTSIICNCTTKLMWQKKKLLWMLKILFVFTFHLFIAKQFLQFLFSKFQKIMFFKCTLIISLLIKIRQ